jgi:hypothetical protein
VRIHCSSDPRHPTQGILENSFRTTERSIPSQEQYKRQSHALWTEVGGNAPIQHAQIATYGHRDPHICSGITFVCLTIRNCQRCHVYMARYNLSYSLRVCRLSLIASVPYTDIEVRPVYAPLIQKPTLTYTTSNSFGEVPRWVLFR